MERHRSVAIEVDNNTTRLPARRVRRGIAFVWAAVFLAVLIGIAGLSLDWGKMAFNVHQLHNAADAAALAGAQFVKFDHDAARRQARAIAAQNSTDRVSVFLRDNPSNDPSLDVVVGYWVRQTRTFTPFDPANPTPTNAVKVVAPRTDDVPDGPLPLIFGSAFGTSHVSTSRHAIAWSRGSTGAGIIVLTDNPSIYPGWNHATGLLMDGGTTVDLRGPDGEIGDIQVNATSLESAWAAFRLNGTSADIWAGEFNVVGTTRPDPNDAGAWEALYADGAYPFSVNPDSPSVPDPLAAVVAPDIDTMTIPLDRNGKPYLYTITDSVVADAGGTLILTPGYYPYGINLANQGIVELTGGADAVYAFGGGDKQNKATGLVLSGGTLRTREGEGAMVYVTGDPDGSHPQTDVTYYGKIDIGGNAIVQLMSRGDAMTPPNTEGELGIAIWQDRSNPSYGKIIGTSGSAIKGTIYCGYNAMEVGGTASQMGNQLISGALWLHGTMSLGIAYDGRNTVEGYRAMLVE